MVAGRDEKAAIARALRESGCSVYEIGEPATLLIGCRGKTILMQVEGAKRAPLSGRQLMAAQRGREGGWKGGIMATAGNVDEALEIVWRIV